MNDECMVRAINQMTVITKCAIVAHLLLHDEANP